VRLAGVNDRRVRFAQSLACRTSAIYVNVAMSFATPVQDMLPTTIATAPTVAVTSRYSALLAMPSPSSHGTHFAMFIGPEGVMLDGQLGEVPHGSHKWIAQCTGLLV
jgi:hypothetical protein